MCLCALLQKIKLKKKRKKEKEKVKSLPVWRKAVFFIFEIWNMSGKPEASSADKF